jgi:hypothetical protein
MRDATMGSSWLSPKIEVRRSALHGKGLFARQAIDAGERLVVFGGEIMLIAELNRLPSRLQNYPFQIEERFVLGSRSATGPQDAERFNHSCEPNCGFKGQIFLVAMRRIRTHEELTIDYAMVVSKSVGSRIVFEMRCRCGAPKCRKLVTENDWKNPDLQERYAGFFSQYLAEKIMRAAKASGASSRDPVAAVTFSASS